jgi:hypothetical protein
VGVGIFYGKKFVAKLYGRKLIEPKDEKKKIG